MVKGAELLSDTVIRILGGNVTSKPQDETINGELKDAPKIFKADCKVDWNNSSTDIHNKIRGLSPYPTAWTVIEKDGKSKSLKLFESEKIIDGNNNTSKIKSTDELLIGTNDGWIRIHKLQLEGKKKMNTSDFVKGFQFDDWTIQA